MAATGRVALLGALMATATALHVTNKGDGADEDVCRCRPWNEAYTKRFHSCGMWQKYMCEDMLLKMKTRSSCINDWDAEAWKSIRGIKFLNGSEQYCIVDARCPEGDRATHWAIKSPKDPTAALGLWKRRRCGAGDDKFNQKTMLMLQEIAETEELDLGMLLKIAYPVVTLHDVKGTLLEELQKSGAAGIVIDPGSNDGHLHPAPPFDVVTGCGTMTVSGGWMEATATKKDTYSGPLCTQLQEKDRGLIEVRAEKERLRMEARLAAEEARLKLERAAKLREEEAARRVKEARLKQFIAEELKGDDFQWEEGRELNCYGKHMDLPDTPTTGFDAETSERCKTLCALRNDCHGVSFVGRNKKCYLRQNVDLSQCKESQVHVSYKKLALKKDGNTTAELRNMLEGLDLEDSDLEKFVWKLLDAAV